MNDDVSFFTTMADFRANGSPHYERFARSASRYLLLELRVDHDLGRPVLEERSAESPATDLAENLKRCSTEEERARAIWDVLVDAHDGGRNPSEEDPIGRRRFIEMMTKRFVTRESLRRCVDGSLRDFWYADPEFRRNLEGRMLRSHRVSVVTWPSPNDERPSSDEEEEEVDCSVCVGTCEEGPDKSVMRLPCGHDFHAGCLAKMMGADHKKCPMCRARLKTIKPIAMSVV